MIYVWLIGTTNKQGYSTYDGEYLGVNADTMENARNLIMENYKDKYENLLDELGDDSCEMFPDGQPFKLDYGTG